MKKYNLKFNNSESKYLQIYNNVKELIDKGNIVDGEKLPSIRSFAKYYDVNTVTIVNAYEKLK